TAAWDGRTQFGHCGSTEECIETAYDPDVEEAPGIRKAAGDVAACAYDSRGDGVTDRVSNSKPHAKNFQQPAAAERLSGRRQRAGRQFSSLKKRPCSINKSAIII